MGNSSIKQRLVRGRPSVVVGPGHGEESASAWGQLVSSLVTGARTSRHFSSLEINAAPGWRRRTYFQPQADEFFSVLDGEFSFEVGDRARTLHLGPGCLLYVPCGMPRNVRNIGEGSGTLLILRMPRQGCQAA